MGFYRIIKNVIRFILYQLPKKWLIMIIFALAMTFGLTQVKGYSFDNYTGITTIDSSQLVFYDGIKLKYPLVTDINANWQTPYELSVRYTSLPLYNIPLACGSNNYSKELFGTKPNAMYLYTPNVSGTKITQFYGADNNNYFDFPFNQSYVTNNTDFVYNYKMSRVNNGNTMTMSASYSASYNTDNNYTNVFNFTENINNSYLSPLVFSLYGGSNYYICSFVTEDGAHALYPATLGVSAGLFDIVTSKFYYLYGADNFEVANVINEPTIAPKITNSLSSIEGYSFNFLEIDGNSLKPSTNYGQNYFSLVTNYMGISVTTDLDNYMNINNNTISFSVPKSELIDNPSVATGRSVNWTLLYYKAIEGGRDIIEYDLGTYTFDLSNNTQEENNTIQQDTTLSAIAGVSNSINNVNTSINNLNNSQQETNNFLKNENVNTNNKNLPSPTIENSQVISQVDNAYSDFFEDYLLLFASDLPVTIDLYIPNMSTGGIASTISIPSNYVKAHLSSLSIPFINYSMLELVYMVWYVLFAFWFLGFATNLVTILYSGEIMQDKGLSKLTKTYTGVSKNML